MHCKFIISLIALLSIKQIDSTCTSKFPIYGIQIDVPFSVFSGLKIAYQQPYTDPTASGILQGIKDSCTENSVACVGCCDCGGLDVGPIPGLSAASKSSNVSYVLASDSLWG